MAAYNAPGFTCTVSDPTPAAGVPVTVVCTGAQPGEVLTLTATRNPAANFDTKWFTATANGSGVATFTLTLAPAGAYTLMVKGASGAVISTQTVKVLGVGAAAPGRLGWHHRRSAQLHRLRRHWPGGRRRARPRGRRHRSDRPALQIVAGSRLIQALTHERP